MYESYMKQDLMNLFINNLDMKQIHSIEKMVGTEVREGK